MKKSTPSGKTECFSSENLYFFESMMTQKQLSVTTIHADQLTVGDVIRYFTGDLWQVATEPKYTRQGITFKVYDLSVNTTETQTVTFAPQWRFELISYHSVSKEVAA